MKHPKYTAVLVRPTAPKRTSSQNRARTCGLRASARTDVTAATLARLIEEAARMVITRIDASSSHARGLAVRTVLSIAGLSWRETDALLEAHPELAEEE